MKRYDSIACLVLTAVLAVSCADDLTETNGLPQKNQIQFSVDDSQDWYQTGGDEIVTRAMERRAFTPFSTTLKADNGADMMLTATVVNGISDHQLAGKPTLTTNAETRGTAHNALTNTFQLLGYKLSPTDTWGSAIKPLADIYDITVSSNGNGAWTTENSIYWTDEEDAMRFFA